MYMTIDPLLSYCNPMENMLSSNRKLKNKIINSNLLCISSHRDYKTYHSKAVFVVFYSVSEYNTDISGMNVILISVPTTMTGKLSFEQECPIYFT